MASGGLGLFLLFVLGLPTSSVENPTPIRVSLDAPPDCSTPEAFYQGVRDRTDRVRPATESEGSIELAVRLVRTGTKVQGELRMIGEQVQSDTRRVEGATCQEVVEALSLTAALALDPTARLIVPPAPAPPPAPEPPSAPPYEPPPQLVAPPVIRSAEFSLGAQALVGEIIAPEASFGGGVFVRVATFPDRASGQSVTVGLFHVRNDLFRTPADARYRLTAFSISGCPTRLRLSRIATLEPCATTVAGWVGAAGRGFQHTTSAIETYWSVGGSVLLRVAEGPGPALDLSAGATLPLLRREYTAQNPDRVLGKTPVISALAGAGLSWGF